MYTDDAPRFGLIRRHPFVVLSLVLHAVPLVALYHLGSQRIELVQRERQQRQVESGARLTAQARLEKRVHDMERIKSLLEQSAAAHPAENKEDEVQFSAQPKAPDELLKQAKELSRKIDEIERDTKAERLAKLLDIPKEKALEQVAEKAKAEEPPAAEPQTPAPLERTVTHTSIGEALGVAPKAVHPPARRAEAKPPGIQLFRGSQAVVVPTGAAS